MGSVHDWLVKMHKQAEDPDHIQATEALALLLEGQSSPSDAARTITAAYEPSLRSTRPVYWKNSMHYTKVCHFWTSYMTGAIMTFSEAEERERLFELLVEISRQPDILDDTGCSLQAYTPDGVYWSDLPAFGRMLAMEGLEICYIDDFPDSERDKYLAQIPGYLNATRFAAAVLQHGLCASAFSLEAACALNAGLEHEYDERSILHVVAGVDKDNWPALIPAAAIWLMIAGEQIYEHCVSGDTNHGWDRGRWNMDPWALWKQQLGKFAKRVDFSDDCRDFSAETLNKMIEIEGGEQD